jgi:D-serine deaminase-like pyridoxal phosphate-dependent protein
MCGSQTTGARAWFRIENAKDIPSPALLVYPDRIRMNIAQMIAIAGKPDVLWPHVKTHKMSEITKLQINLGINKFKCSTIAEAEMAASSGAKHILLALQPVGPNLQRFFLLRKHFPATDISTLADDGVIIDQLSAMAVKTGLKTRLWLDINNGMNRTGIAPGEDALRLYLKISNSPMLEAAGLHVYDGHIHEKDPARRQEICEKDFRTVTGLLKAIIMSGLAAPDIIAGGSPTFPIHARRSGIGLSPGTTLLWDQGYTENYPDLGFLIAAVLLTRIVSKPYRKLLCFDLGHKAVAAEMPHPRVSLPEFEQYRFLSHHEEHLVIETEEADNWKTGDFTYAIPWHICPTVARFPVAHVVRNAQVTEQWKVEARDRRITL